MTLTALVQGDMKAVILGHQYVTHVGSVKEVAPPISLVIVDPHARGIQITGSQTRQQTASGGLQGSTLDVKLQADFHGAVSTYCRK